MNEAPAPPGEDQRPASASSPAAGADRGATVTLPEQLQGKKLLGPDDKFCFGCHEGLKCFTRCCADANIFLTPVDVLRLARRLGTSTTEFLSRHAMVPITKQLHLPVVMLRMSDDEQKRCSFVAEDGCTVYEDRPWACRMFPLGLGLPPARAGVEPEPVYFLVDADFCDGYREPTEWTVREWRENQRAMDQESLEKGFQQLVSHPFFIGGRQLDPKRIEMFYMACYDLDKFRGFVFESSFLERFEVDEALVEQLRSDDEALLRFAFRWLRFALFAEPTMQVRERTAEKGR